MPILRQNEWIYRHTFSYSDRGIVLVSSDLTAVTKFQGEPVIVVVNDKGWEIFANIALYVGNGTR